MVEKPAQYVKFESLLRPLDGEGRYVGDSDQLLRDADAAAALLDHPGWEVVQRMLAALMHEDTILMRHGSVREQADYVRVNARCAGLELAVHAPKAVLYAADVTRQELEQRAARTALAGERSE